MHDGNPPEIRGQFHQSAIKFMPSICCLLERRTGNGFRKPAETVEVNIRMGFYFNAKNAYIGRNDNKIDFSPKAAIPRREIQRVERHPIIRAGGEQVEHVALAGWRALVHK